MREQIIINVKDKYAVILSQYVEVKRVIGTTLFFISDDHIDNDNEFFCRSDHSTRLARYSSNYQSGLKYQKDYIPKFGVFVIHFSEVEHKPYSAHSQHNKCGLPPGHDLSCSVNDLGVPYIKEILAPRFNQLSVTDLPPRNFYCLLFS